MLSMQQAATAIVMKHACEVQDLQGCGEVCGSLLAARHTPNQNHC